MSSFFDEASLVMIPSGYKDQKVYSVKPLDGSGDLTFSRASSATRVQSDGLIEKVRTNHVLQSNTFSDAAWAPTTLTATSGATDPNGGTTAWTLANTAASGIIQQAVTLTGLRTFSIYAKQGTHRYLYMGAYGGTISYATFDLQNGTIPAGSNARIESIGNGWYRCICHSADGTTGGVQIFPTDTISSGATTNGNILAWNCQYESGDIATDYIATTTAAVSVGPVSGLPRLDYLNSTCPRLLLEPQRTNTAGYSEQFDNAYWTKNAVTIVANSATSPSGYQDADLMYPASAGISRYVLKFVGATSGLAYTTSVFAKASGKNWLGMANVDTGSTTAWFNLSTGTVGTVLSGTTATITDYGNGWYRCSVTRTSADTTGAAIFLVEDADNSDSITPNGTDGILIWGAQLEEGAYATSYIPTLGTSVTRVADAAQKDSITSLIGQTAGTIYWESNQIGGAQISLNTSASVSSDGVQIYGSDNTLNVYIQQGGTARLITSLGAVTQGSNFKIALAYGTNFVRAYINGVQTYTTSATIPMPTLAMLNLSFYGGGGAAAKSETKQVLLFKSILTNAQLAELTTL
jgi:hypothetical protein